MDEAVSLTVFLAGLAGAWFAMAEKEKARDAYARLLHVRSDADPGLKLMERVKALGLPAEPTGA